MKTISVLIPCFNETDNVIPMSEAVVQQFKENLPQYDYELIFIDNFSTDGTREKLEQICSKNKKIKAILNAKNFGQFNSPFYGLCQTSGDCTVTICCDFQDPVDLIPRLVHEWEKGYKIVSAIKTESEENRLVRFLRTCYYKLIKKCPRWSRSSTSPGRDCMIRVLLMCCETCMIPRRSCEVSWRSWVPCARIFPINRKSAAQGKRIITGIPCTTRPC